jgi:hypothetical protein
MFALIALICVLDGSTRGHHCDTKVYTERFQSQAQCDAFRVNEIFYVQRPQGRKVAMSECRVCCNNRNG